MLEVEDILKLSKNRNTVHQGQKISKEKYWKNPAFKGAYIWATFKGKSIQSYTSLVNLSTPISFKCNCSSRQSPCKHSLALLLYYRDNGDNFKEQEALLKGVKDWIKQRKDIQDDAQNNPLILAEKREKALQSKQQNRAKRITQMQAGSFHLQDWLRDILKSGLAQLEGQGDEFWDAIMARVVDHKLAGLSFYINEIKSLITTDDNWMDLVPLKMAWLNQVLSGIQQLDQWKEDWQTELLRIGGVTTRVTDLEEMEPIEDDWVILHLDSGETDNGGFFRRVWLLGKQSNRFGFQLDYNFREPKFPAMPKLGRWFTGTTVFYPGPTPLRLIIKSFGTPLLNVQQLPGLHDFKSLNQYFLANLKINPWLLNLPVILHDIIPSFTNQPVLIDASQAKLILNKNISSWWDIMAISAGGPISMFGLWNGYEFQPKGVLKKERYYPLLDD